VSGAPKAMPIKTDRRDAEGVARLLHLSMMALELSLRGLLWNFG
jgi:hypothetical protein